MEIHVFSSCVLLSTCAHPLFHSLQEVTSTSGAEYISNSKWGVDYSWSLLSSQAHPLQHAQAKLPRDPPPSKASCGRTGEWCLIMGVQWSSKSYSTREGVFPIPLAGKLQKHLLHMHSAAHLSQHAAGGHCSNRDGHCLYTTAQQMWIRQN